MKSILKNKVLIISFILIIIITLFYFVNINNKEKNRTDQIIINESEINTELKKIQKLYEKYQNKKLLALTFDDGPSKYTDELLNILKEKNIKATFFIMGQSLEKNPNILEKEIKNGNEIGIHCYSHKLFTRLTEDQIKEQIKKTYNLIYEDCSISPKLIRVPYGSLNNKVKNVLNNLELTSVLWNVDSLDWKFKNTTKTYNYVLKRTTGNDIILMHDTFRTSVKAAEKIIDHYLSEGYTFVTVSEFLKVKEYAKSINE